MTRKLKLKSWSDSHVPYASAFCFLIFEARYWYLKPSLSSLFLIRLLPRNKINKLTSPLPLASILFSTPHQSNCYHIFTRVGNWLWAPGAAEIHAMRVAYSLAGEERPQLNHLVLKTAKRLRIAQTTPKEIVPSMRAPTITSALRRRRQEICHKFEASLERSVNLSQNGGEKEGEKQT